jgi:hypothetical protein
MKARFESVADAQNFLKKQRPTNEFGTLIQSFEVGWEGAALIAAARPLAEAIPSAPPTFQGTGLQLQDGGDAPRNAIVELARACRTLLALMPPTAESCAAAADVRSRYGALPVRLRVAQLLRSPQQLALYFMDQAAKAGAFARLQPREIEAALVVADIAPAEKAIAADSADWKRRIAAHKQALKKAKARGHGRSKSG